MKPFILQEAERKEKTHRRRSLWYKVVSSLACVVVFCTVYALILPAITMEAGPICGHEEHLHGDACYQAGASVSYLECQAKPHQHTETCYDENKKLICGYADFYLHTHTEDCYQDGLLVCPLEEAEAHTHTAACYDAETKELICKQEEFLPHVHDDSCYDVDGSLICGKLEVEEHQHTAECFRVETGEPVLICTLEEHTHVDECWPEEETLPEETQTGEMPESSAAYLCGQEEHSHSLDCYNEENELICEVPEHMHEAACLPAEENLPEESSSETTEPVYFCGREAHMHEAACYDEAGELICTREEHEHDGICETDPAALAGIPCRRLDDISQLAPDEACILAQETGDGEIILVQVSGEGLDVASAVLNKAYNEDGGLTVALALPGAGAASIPEGYLWTPTKLGEGGDAVLANTVDTETILTVIPDADGGFAVAGPAQTYADGEDVGNVVEIYAVDAAVAAKSVNDWDELVAALENPDTTETITVGTIEITSEKTLDLNGHTIDASGGGFVVKDGGSLTITDRVGATDVADDGVSTTAADAGKLATLTGDTLTYYVTKTEVVDDSIGATQETLVTHTVELKGKVVGGGISVEMGGSFTLNGGAICQVENAYAINSTGGTVTIDGGYICGNGGGVKADGGTITMDGGVIAGNKADWGGGIHIENGELYFLGGVISGNNANTNGGGGIYANQSQVQLLHGYITNNIGADNTPEYTGGGGVLCHSNCTLIVGEGTNFGLPIYITANKACSGGGITTYNMDGGVGNTVTMKNGFVTGNLATKAEGGGIAIRARTTAEIRGGYITNNVKATNESWGGGGVFGQQYSSITIYQALITENNASGFGGGVTGCSTGTVLVQDTEGAAIYDNHADGDKNHMATSAKGEDHDALTDPVFMQGDTYQDYFCALTSMVKGGMLGGGVENWYGSADSVRVSADSADDVLTSSIRMGLNAKPSETNKQNAQQIARVFINGNSSATHGGGVLANGILVLGNNDELFEIPGTLAINAKKALEGKYDNGALAGYRFTFVLMDSEHKELATTQNDDNGLIAFPKIKFDQEGKYIFYLREAVSDDPSIIKDDREYRLEVKVIKKQVAPVNGDGSSAYICYQPTDYNFYLVEGNKQLFEGTCTPVKNGVHESACDFFVNLFDRWGGGEEIKYDFNNTFADKVSISVTKEWRDAEGKLLGEHPDSVTVYLTKNGERYEGDDPKSPVVLNALNGWSYSWTELPGKDESGASIRWDIEEEGIGGWTPHITYGKPDESEPGGGEEENGPKPVTSPEVGKEYYLATGDTTYFVIEKYISFAIISAEQLNEQGVNPRYVVEQGDDNNFYIRHVSTNKYLSLIKYTYNPDTTPAALDWTTGNVKSPVSFDSEGFIKAGIIDQNGTFKSEEKYICMYTQDGNLKLGVSDVSDNGFRFYTAGSSGGGEEPGDGSSNDVTATITNTPRLNAYDLKVLKADADDNSKLLSGAEFQLLQNGEILKFTEKDGVYSYNPQGSVTTLVTGEDGTLTVKDLPAGTYTLRETKAPAGYDLAGDKEVTLGGAGSPDVTEVTVEDKLIFYELPDTGGPGTYPYTMAGLLLCSAAYSKYKVKKRRKEENNS